MNSQFAYLHALAIAERLRIPPQNIIKPLPSYSEFYVLHDFRWREERNQSRRTFPGSKEFTSELRNCFPNLNVLVLRKDQVTPAIHSIDTFPYFEVGIHTLSDFLTNRASQIRLLLSRQNHYDPDDTLLDPNLIDFLSNCSGEQVQQLIQSGMPFSDAIISALNQLTLERTVAEFKLMMSDHSLSEEQWQTFFSRHHWIFGLHIDTVFLKQLKDKAYVGGQTYDGTGAKHVDYVMSSEFASKKLLKLIEIKKPSTCLVASSYRGNIYPPSSELSGGVQQLQYYIQLHDRNLHSNQEYLDQNVQVTNRRGLLLIGDSRRLTTNDQAETRHRINSFELYRNTQQNIEIVTFDELLTRCEATIEVPEKHGTAFTTS